MHVKPAQSSKLLKVALLEDDAAMPATSVGRPCCPQLDQPASMDTQAAVITDSGKACPASQSPAAEKIKNCKPPSDICMQSSASPLSSTAMLQLVSKPVISDPLVIYGNRSFESGIVGSQPVHSSKMLTLRPSIARFGPVSNVKHVMNLEGSPILWNDPLKSAAVTRTYLRNTSTIIIPSEVLASIKPALVIYPPLDGFGHVSPVSFHIMLSWVAMILGFASLIAYHSDGTWDPGGVAESLCPIAFPKATVLP